MARRLLVYAIPNKTAEKTLSTLASEIATSSQICVLYLSHHRNQCAPKVKWKRLHAIGFSQAIRYMATLQISTLLRIAGYFLFSNNFPRNAFIELNRRLYADMDDQICKVFSKFNPDAVLVYGDRHLWFEPSVISQAKRLNIPVCIPPGCGFAEEKSLMLRRTQKKTIAFHDVTSDAEFKAKFPMNWRHDPLTSSDISYYSIHTTLALDSLRLLPSNPWVMGASGCTTLMTSSIKEFDSYTSYKDLEDKVILTGCLDEDKLYKAFYSRESLKQQLTSSYFPNKHPLLICALPQLYHESITDKRDHWRWQDSICNILSRLDVNALLALHPKMNRLEYMFLERKYNVRLLRESLADALPGADIFVALSDSSTIHWAVLAETPVLAMDWFVHQSRNQSNDSDLAEVMVKIRSLEHLESAISKAIKEQSYLEDLKNNLRKYKVSCKTFDGCSLQRIISSI